MAKKMNGFTIFLWSMLGTVAGAFVLGAFANVARDDEKKKDKDETTVETAVDFSIFSDPTKYTAEEVVPVEQGGQEYIPIAGKYVWIPAQTSLSNLVIGNQSVVTSDTEDSVDNESLTANLFFGYTVETATVLMTRDYAIETDIQYKYYEASETVENSGTIFYFGEGTYNATIKDGYEWKGSFTYTITDETMLSGYTVGMYILTPTA